MPRIGIHTCSFKDKTTIKPKESRRKPKSRKGKTRIGGAFQTARSCHHHHGKPWWWCPRCFSRFPNATVCTCSGPRALPVLGHFQPFFTIFFDPHGLKNIF
uniref:Uncharacterized protein n=1 Tax=Opuntia streptacantha TaxID=393608 RepID=A0A7C9DRX8_OPUST